MNNTFQIVDLSASTYCVEEIPANEAELKLQEALRENQALSNKVRELEHSLNTTIILNKTEAKLQKALQNSAISSMMTPLDETLKSTIQGENGEIELQEAIEENVLLSKKVRSLEDSLKSVSSELKVSEGMVENLKMTVELMSKERKSNEEGKKQSTPTLKESSNKTVEGARTSGGNSHTEKLVKERKEMEKQNLELWEKLTRLENEFDSQKELVSKLKKENEMLSSALSQKKSKETPYEDVVSNLKKKKAGSGLKLGLGLGFMVLLLAMLLVYVFFKELKDTVQTPSEL